MSQIGRNDPCACGSGKKYKKCCLSLEEKEKNPPVCRLREISRSLDLPLLKHGKKLYGDDFFLGAWNDFWESEEREDSLELDSITMQWFFPWIFYHWIPREYSQRSWKIPNLGKIIAADYLEKQERRIDLASQQLIKLALQEPYSLWEVHRVERGVGLELKDLFLNRQCFVKEVSG